MIPSQRHQTTTTLIKVMVKHWKNIASSRENEKDMKIMTDFIQKYKSKQSLPKLALLRNKLEYLEN